ncbi:MAG: hypothetical protein V4495_17410 [Pseudomonadota bacterium]
MSEIHPHVFLLAEYLAATPDYTDDTINEHLKSGGLNDKEVNALIRCIQVAWGRRAVAHTGAKSSDEYVIANAADEIVKRANFTHDPYFNNAIEQYENYASSEGCIRFARESAEYNAVQRSIAEGSDITTSTPLPQIVLVGEWTHESVLKVVDQLRASLHTPVAKSTPWWKFW